GVPPHETFEEMANDYLAEIRMVQPHGPYLLAGFSGGGITAYEMARQLGDAGETVAQLVMLDTPLATQIGLSKRDLISMKMQDLRRHGVGFLGEWMRNKIEWKAKQRQLAGLAADPTGAETFRN